MAGRRISWFLPIIAVAVNIFGQPLYTPAVLSPAAPTQADRIRATFGVIVCGDPSLSTTVTGNIIRTTIMAPGPCIIGEVPPRTFNEVFGPLAPGTYDYEIFIRYDTGGVELRSRQTLVISADVPALDRPALLMLAVILCAIGAITLPRAAAFDP